MRREDGECLPNDPVSYHERAAGRFAAEYRHLTSDYFHSAFTYGRRKLDAILDTVLRDLPNASSLLDIGCGTGEQLRKCREAGLRVTGLEPAANMRTIAQRGNPGVPILEGVVTNLPFPDRSFDLVLTIEVLRYLPHADLQRAYREMLRVLKPGGIVFFTIPNRYALTGFYLYDTVRRFRAHLTGRTEPVHCEFVTPGQVRRDLRRLGAETITFRGSVVLPIRPLYRVSGTWAARTARWLEPLDDALSRQAWTTPFAARLVVMASSPRADDTEHHG